MTDYEVQVQTVTSRSLAVAHGAASREALGETITRLLDRVWAVLRRQGVRTGHNVVLYPEGGLMNIEAGVEVLGPFGPTDEVAASATPAGSAAMTTHWGEYDHLINAHLAINEWCTVHGKEPAGPSWEVYGDWSDDPAQRRTDVYILLKE
jgi:effector-binding domain-containing protein